MKIKQEKFIVSSGNMEERWRKGERKFKKEKKKREMGPIVV